MSSQSYFFNPQDDRMSCAGSGLQFPRLSTSQRLALTVGTNDAGMTVFDITGNALYVWTGSAWTQVGSGGGGGSYVTIYSGASTTPQAFTWTIVDGQVTQVGLDVEATTGTTSIFIGAGKTLDGIFDLTPIGTTLASFQISGCTVGTFSPGILANLSYLGLDASTIAALDVTGCQNQLALVVNNCTIPSFTASNSTSLYSVTFGFGGVYGDLDLTNCPALVTADFGIYQATSITLDNCDSVTAIVWNTSAPSASYGIVTISNCDTLGQAILSNFTAASINISNCPLLGTILATIIVTTLSGLTSNAMLNYISLINSTVTDPINVSGMTQLNVFETGGGVFGDINASGSGVVSLANNSATYGAINFSACLSLTDMNFAGSTFTSLNASGCTLLNGVNLNNCTFTSVNFSGSFSPGAIVSISGSTFSTIDFTGRTNLGSLGLGASTFTNVNLAGCTGLTSLNAESAVLTNILNFNDCRALVTVDLDFTAMPTVDVTGFTALTSLSLRSWTGTTITGLGDADALVTLDLTSAASITTLDLSGCLGAFALTGIGMTALTTLNMSGCSNAVSANVSNVCPSLTSVDLSGCAALVNFTTGRTVATGTVPLSAITITTLPACRTFRSASTSLPAANVNAILVALDANGLTSGSVSLQFGANAAPTGAGITAKNNLIAKGWTVFTN
jgi:hypothetical protein